MYLEQRYSFFNPAPFNLSTNTILGTTQRWAIDRTWPIEEILIFVNFDVQTGWTTTNSTTPDMHDNLLALLGRVNLSVNDGRQPRSVVDASGVGLLEYVSNAGWNLDTATMAAVAASANPVGALAVPVGIYSICYRIPCAPIQVGEPLRSRLYLPVHTYPQDPVLTLSFNTVAACSAVSTGSVDNVTVDVVLIRRVPTRESEALLRSTAGSNPNGYIDWDLIETPFTIPLGSAAEFRAPLPVPGNYIDLLFRQYRGGSAPLSRIVTIDNETGAAKATLGSETRWRLESGLVVLREWRWRHLRTLNDYTKPQGSTFINPIGCLTGGADAATVDDPLILRAGNFPTNNMAATAQYRAGTSCMIPFLQDGVTGDTGNELGSLLDCNTPANNGLKMEVIGTPASVSPNPSMLFIMGRRLFGDISRWQKF
jgi:hypothetical protein